jgi:EAL domain-containing protein (putative c-di-GMP-specific phosphodiesterase class I)
MSSVVRHDQSYLQDPSGNPKADLSEAGTLYLWFPDAPLRARALLVLEMAGLPCWLEGTCARLNLGAGRLDAALLDLGGALTLEETRRIRALFLPGSRAPGLDDFGRIGSFHELLMTAQTGWLLEQFEAGTLTSHFHPLVHVGATTRVFAHEALLRGQGRDGHPLQPLDVFHGAREAGLLQELDLAACRCAIRESAYLDEDVTVFVNFSPAMIDDAEGCLRSTMASIEAAGLAPDRFVFEVIEADRIEDADQLKRVLDAYRRDGFRVALDDLGAGWSTLSLVHRLQPDFIKLDRELIREVNQDRVKDLIASKLLEIGHGLGIRTIVEGVETAAELEWAEARGADFVQGFLIARPGPSPRPGLLS